MLHPETTISSYNGAFVGELPLDQLAARTNDLAVAEGRLSEVETLNLAGVAVRELNDAGLYRVNIMNAWFSNAQSIDPDYNYAGFLDWDGQTETQPMGHARSALHELHEGRLALARSIVSLTLKTHLRYREEGHFYPTSESVAARTSQHVKDLLRNYFGAELHPSY